MNGLAAYIVIRDYYYQSSLKINYQNGIWLEKMSWIFFKLKLNKRRILVGKFINYLAYNNSLLL